MAMTRDEALARKRADQARRDARESAARKALKAMDPQQASAVEDRADFLQSMDTGKRQARVHYLEQALQSADLKAQRAATDEFRALPEGEQAFVRVMAMSVLARGEDTVTNGFAEALAEHAGEKATAEMAAAATRASERGAALKSTVAVTAPGERAETRTCTSCGEVKPVSEFPKGKSMCKAKDCYPAACKAWNAQRRAAAKAVTTPVGV